MTQFLRIFPFTLITTMIICYLSFFQPPQTSLNEVPYIDKLVHICMYGGLTTILWIEHLFHTRPPHTTRFLVAGILAPIILSGCIELLQEYFTENRSGDWWDFSANVTGVLLAGFAGYYAWSPLFQKYKSKASRRNKKTA